MMKLSQTASLLFGIGLCFTGALHAQEVSDEDVEAAVKRATDYLLTQQEEKFGFFKPEGNWGNWGPQKDGRFRPPKHSSAMTALGIMGLASVGHLPSDPTPEGRAAQRALEFMLRDDLRDPHGYFGEMDNSQMYGHGIVALMLAEMVGMGVSEEQDARIREVCQKAIDLILAAQRHPKSDKHKGGWRYSFRSNDADLSVTVWQVMALRAAKNAGLEVPKEAIDDAVEYVKRCYDPKVRAARGNRKEGDPPEKGGFAYEAGNGGHAFAPTAAGLLSLQVCGSYDLPEVEGGANFLLEKPPKHGDSWFYYGLYYYSQGMHQKGDHWGEVAKEFTRKKLMELQRDDGSWEAKNGSEKKVGRIYATSLSLLSLSVQHGFLPIYQR